MKTLKLLFITAAFFVFSSNAFADNFGGGSRASFTRGGWVGAEYIAMGKAAEVIADDAFAIYWNPAGLTGLTEGKNLSSDDITNKARSGNISEITEDALLAFSDDQKKKTIVHIGISGSILDAWRNTGFVGVAFNLPAGVFGIGFYSLFSLGIEARDATGALIGSTNYLSGISFLSYGLSIGVVSIGASLKVLYEGIGDVNYLGFGADVGVNVSILPFIKAAFVVQDICTGLFPLAASPVIGQKYDFGYPTLKLGLAVETDFGLTIAFSLVKKIEIDPFGFSFGVRYDVAKFFTLSLGVSDLLFSTGAIIKIYSFNMAYAFSIDRIDYGYNHTVSLSMLF